MLDNTEKFWEKSWIEKYFKDLDSVLEIAGGSCRDSGYLSSSGFKATGSDFDEKTLQYIQEERFPNERLNYLKEDAFNLTFKEKSKNDDLYKIRFFDKNEIINIIEDSDIKYKSIKVIKFGGIFDRFYNKRLKKVVPNIFYPFRKSLIPKLYQLQKWKNTERVCCIVELNK